MPDRGRGGARPANCSGVVAVTAFDYRLNGVPERQGPLRGGRRPRGAYAEGEPGRPTGLSSGTSNATALTSGAIALVWSKYPQLTNRQVVARLLATTRDLGAPGSDDEFGYGGIRPYQAITTEVPADAPNPIFDRLPAATPRPRARRRPSPTATVTGRERRPTRTPSCCWSSSLWAG